MSAPKLVQQYETRRKVLREYNESATTLDDALMMCMRVSDSAAVPGADMPAVPDEALLRMHDDIAFWYTIGVQRYSALCAEHARV
jgi:hypothetical protein